MKILDQRQGAVTVVRPGGPLTLVEAEEFKKHVEGVLTGTLGRFVVDMTEIPFVDSAGLEALVDVTERLAESGQTLKLCAVNKTIREVLSVTDLAPMFEHFEDVNTAIRSFL